MDYYPPALPHPVVVMFGGAKQGGDFWGDTWFYDQTLLPANPWSQCNNANCMPTTNCSASAPPCNRSGHRVVYYDDGTNKRIFLFGGFRGPMSSEMLGDTWFWQGTNPGQWVKCTSSNGCQATPTPNPRCCVGLAFDSATKQIIMYGGSFYPNPNKYADVWVWDFTGTPGWKCKSPPVTCNGQ